MSFSNLDRRSRRTRTSSSLSGMFEDDQEGTSPLTNNATNSRTERLHSMSRELRRTKRQLFLKSVEQPNDSVNQLRKLMLDLTVDAMDENPSSGSYRHIRQGSSSSLLQVQDYQHRSRSDSEGTTSTEDSNNSSFSSD